MANINIKEAKARIRDEYKEKRKSISIETRQQRDEEINRRFISLSSYRYADIILLYSPLKYEIDTSYIARDALVKGKKIAYPRCIDGNEMVYHFVESLSDFEEGSYHIREPRRDLPVYNIGTGNSMCVLPALVYDKKGYRLGYGKGYYDRFLSKFKGVKAGLIYSDFVIDEIPKGRFDLKSDMIVTEKGVVLFAKN